MAERVNGILKQEYELDATLCTKEQAVKTFMQAVEQYNTKRPHLSLDYRTPEQVHRRPLNDRDGMPSSTRQYLRVSGCCQEAAPRHLRGRLHKVP